MFTRNKGITFVIRSSFRRLSFFKKSKSLNEIELFDIGRLESVLPIASSLIDITLKFDHPLHVFTRNILKCESIHNNAKADFEVNC